MQAEDIQRIVHNSGLSSIGLRFEQDELASPGLTRGIKTTMDYRRERRRSQVRYLTNFSALFTGTLVLSLGLDKMFDITSLNFLTLAFCIHLFLRRR